MTVTYLTSRYPKARGFRFYANCDNTHINIVLWRWLINFRQVK